jgi:hypothetical protein
MCDAVVDELLVQLVKHLEEGTIGTDVVNLVGLEVPFGSSILLSPNM